MFTKNYLPSEYYNSVAEFVKELTEQAKESFDNQIDFASHFVYDSKTIKIIIQVTWRHNLDGVTLSPKLKHFLRFDDNWTVTKEPERIADRTFD